MSGNYCYRPLMSKKMISVDIFIIIFLRMRRGVLIRIITIVSRYKCIRKARSGLILTWLYG